MSFLTEKFDELCRQQPGTKQTGVLRDDLGVYAIEMQSPKGVGGIFCAKRSMGGHLVSCHQALFDKARAERKAIVMAVGDAFYWFDPFKLNKGKINLYRGIPMVNFGIEQGRKIERQSTEPTLFTQ